MNILIIRVSAIGDVIHTLPALFLIKQCLPNARISWVVQKKAADLLINQPFINRLWVLPDKFLNPTHIPTTLGIIKEMRAIQWDAIVDFQGLLKTSLLLMSLHGQKFGFDRHNARWGSSTWFTNHHTTPNCHHIIEKNMALAADVVHALAPHARPLTLQQLQQSFYMYFPQKTKDIVTTWLANNNIHQFIALCPNTTWQSKLWPTERWLQLMALLVHAFPSHRIVIIGTSFGPAAADLAWQAEKNNLAHVNLPAWDLLTTGYALTQTATLVAPDTGLLHLADYLGTPAIGIFGPSLKDRHGPFITPCNINHAIQVDCPHRYAKQHGATDCMATLNAHDVAKHLTSIITQPKRITYF